MKRRDSPRSRGARFPSDYPRAWWVYLAAGIVAIGAYYLLPGEVLPAVVYELVGISAVVAIGVGVHLHQPARRAPWVVMAVGLGIWVVADAVGSWWALTIGTDEFPTAADPVYLVGYPVVAAGLVLLIRGRSQPRDSAGLLDSLILTTSLAALSWILLTRPVIATYADSPAAAVIAASYPVMDIVLAGMVVRLLTTPSGRTRSFRLLVYALILLIIADSASTALSMLTYEASEPLDLFWLASYLAWGAAALEPSMTSLSAPTAATPQQFTRARLAALTVAVLIPPLTLAAQAALGLPPTIWAVVVFSIIAVLLVVARMNLSIRQIQAANAEVAAAQAELTHQAAHDPLTGLANRAQAMNLITGALSRGQRSGAVVGLLFIDLDGFKQVNDTLGHPAGDEVLRVVARRMQEAVRAGDVVARLGGDEFVVLLEPLDEQASGQAVAERIIGVVTEPMRLANGHQVRVGASVGLAIAQDAHTDADRLLQEADLAVYRAKWAGRGRIEVFDRTLRDQLVRRSSVEDSIGAALAQDAIEFSVDPVVELITGELASLEAHSRCRIADELVDRSRLLADLGRSPTMIEFDAWTMRRATTALAELGENRSTITVAVPLTGQHLLLDRVREDVATALSVSGLAGDRLVLILTATELNDDTRLLANLEALRAWGTRICLDGFGAGTAPTNQLLHLPISTVRLDDALLRHGSWPASPIAADSPTGRSGPTSPQLLQLTVQTAHAFGYGVVAPRLDTSTALLAATTAGCEFGQGSATTELLHELDPDSVLLNR